MCERHLTLLRLFILQRVRVVVWKLVESRVVALHVIYAQRVEGKRGRTCLAGVVGTKGRNLDGENFP